MYISRLAKETPAISISILLLIFRFAGQGGLLKNFEAIRRKKRFFRKFAFILF